VPARRALLAGAVLVLLLLVLAAAAAASASDEVPRGVRVGGLELGGLSAAEAEQRIAQGLSGETTSPVSLVADDEVLTLEPVAAGLELDAGATAREAADAGPLDRLRALLGAGRQVDPVLDVDGTALTGALQELREGFDREPREGSIAFEGLEPVVTQPQSGRTLDVDGAADAVVEAWPLSLRVEVPVDEREVRTSSDDVDRALREVAEPAVSAPVLLDSEGGTLEVSRQAIAAALRVEADDSGELQPVVDGEVLLEQTAGLRRPLEEPAVDATFDTSSAPPVVVPSQPGRGFGAQDTAEAVRSVLTDPQPRRADVAFTTTEPRVTTETAAGLGVVEQVSSYTSSFPCCAPRVTNIRRIAEIVDGYVVLPGETFDLNAYVGPRDTARGFVPAPQISRGEFVDAVGGGVSQFATTLFNAYFFAGLEDVTHTPHSYYISRYPPGREATVSFPQPDLVFRNDSPHGVLIRATSTGTSVTVAMWGTKRFDVEARQGPRTRVTTAETRYIQRPDCQPGGGGEGFDIVVTRVFSQGGAEVRREDFRTRYLPQPRFVCGAPPPPPAPAPAPAPPAPPAPADPPPAVPPAPAEPAPAPAEAPAAG
jgi:vancomycin resistance protein YoaR